MDGSIKLACIDESYDECLRNDPFAVSLQPAGPPDEINV